ncbi:MAG: outer membrane protein transport protein [Holophagaceae bacterium]|nr:outer membrane protein transport protein [Holophagaceae bacterium]
MARRITMSRGLATSAAPGLLGLTSPVLTAQTIATPASDPVSISRSGAGVAYGKSLEAAALNPALLPTLEGRFQFFLAAGQELESSQTTPKSSQRTVYSTDRNRFLPAFGLAWKLGKSVGLGIKVDTPFLRHSRLNAETPIRFLGDELDLKAQRVEMQLGFALRNDFSIGLGVGFVKIDTASGASLRGLIPKDQTTGATGVSGTNPSEGLFEQRVTQKGSATAPSFSAGFRWAIAPRWTLAGAYQSTIRGTATQTARFADEPYRIFDNLHDSTPVTGLDARTVLGLSRAVAGTDKIALPARVAVGVRQRVNQVFTWELDVRYTQGTQFEFPSMPSMATPSGVVRVAYPSGPFTNSVGLSLLGELKLSKTWVVRGGLSLDQSSRKDEDVEPLLGGQRSSGFSIGFGWQVASGELNFGYQLRQAQDQDPVNLDGFWDVSGYRRANATTRVEGMGHIFSIGFKKIF